MIKKYVKSKQWKIIKKRTSIKNLNRKIFLFNILEDQLKNIFIIIFYESCFGYLFLFVCLLRNVWCWSWFKFELMHALNKTNNNNSLAENKEYLACFSYVFCFLLYTGGVY